MEFHPSGNILNKIKFLFFSEIKVGEILVKSPYETCRVLNTKSCLVRTRFGKGQTGSALMGSLQHFMFFDRGTFWVLLLTYFYLPKSARAYFFSQSVEFITFAAAPLVLTPFVRNQLFKAITHLESHLDTGVCKVSARSESTRCNSEAYFHQSFGDAGAKIHEGL